ncbi:MAG TPA: hypothetical protein VMF50_16865 [Candidatus Binataceae bacterium]|nr:hypothetical protein [Candidatus Binataceae bacterium]
MTNLRTSSSSPSWKNLPLALVLITATVTMLGTASICRAKTLGFGPATFKIYSPVTSNLIGEVHFRVTQSDDGAVTVRSDARYDNGDYDSEDDHLIPRPGGGPLKQISFSHSFFYRDGKPERSSEADFATGLGSCTINDNGHAEVTRSTFNFPADTYAGAPVVIPLRNQLMKKAGVVDFHYFTCIPGPRLVTVRATAGSPAPWKYWPGEVVEVDVQPSFGWLTSIISPFLPTVRAWFDPSRDWYLVGVESARFYRGTRILMVGVAPPSKSTAH